jgi:hypothetical protein
MLVISVAAKPAFADARETYAVVTLGPSVLVLKDAEQGKASSARPALLAELACFYGLTNTLHVGGAFRFAVAKNFAFDGVTISQPTSSPRGSLYEDATSFGLAAFLAYRVDTGYHLAPVGRLELTATSNHYGNIELVPDGTNYIIGLPSVSEFSLGARALLGAEYRIGDRWVATLGIAVRRDFGGHATFALDVPASIAIVFE